MTHRNHYVTRQLCVFVLALAAACGGSDAISPGEHPVVPPAPDTAGPTITIQPYDSLTTSSSFTLSGTATDSSDVVTISIQREPLPCCIGPVDTVARRGGQSVAFSRTYPLGDASYLFHVRATDGKGNTRTSTLSVRSDQTAPELFVVAPWSAPGGSARIHLDARAPEDTLSLAYAINGGPSIAVGPVTGTPEIYPIYPRRNEFMLGFDVPLVGDSESVTIFVRDAAGNTASTLVHVRRRSPIDQLSVGGHACFLTNAGTAYCWGPNSYGELGTGDTRPTTHPTPVAGSLRFRSITAARGRTCGVTTAGIGYCWGTEAPTFDQPVPPVVAPDSIPGGLRFSTIAVGWGHACGVAVDASVYCWGYNNVGQLGDGTRTYRSVPVRIRSDVAFDSITAGGDYSCALAKSGAAYCWGNNYRGALGIGTFGDTVPVLSPVQATPDHMYRSLQAADDATCGIDVGGAAYCWGDNENWTFGADASPSSQASPVRAVLPEPIMSFSRGVHGCAIVQAGSAYCWGVSGTSSLGRLVSNPTLGFEAIPLPVVIGIAFQDIHVGDETCARTADGALYCWGSQTGKGLEQ